MNFQLGPFAHAGNLRARSTFSDRRSPTESHSTESGPSLELSVQGSSGSPPQENGWEVRTERGPELRERMKAERIRVRKLMKHESKTKVLSAEELIEAQLIPWDWTEEDEKVGVFPKPMPIVSYYSPSPRGLELSNTVIREFSPKVSEQLNDWFGRHRGSSGTFESLVTELLEDYAATLEQLRADKIRSVRRRRELEIARLALDLGLESLTNFSRAIDQGNFKQATFESQQCRYSLDIAKIMITARRRR